MTAPTSDERRAVAEMLRIEVKDEDTSLDYPVCRAINDVLGVNGAWGDRAGRILADLIDPTCHVSDEEVTHQPTLDAMAVHVYTCDICSSPFYMGDICTHPKPLYCPYCGSRVVNDG